MPAFAVNPRTESILQLFTFEPADAYHAQAKDCLSSHRLADFRRCPLLYHQKQTGEIQDEDRHAYLIGRATHTLVGEGRAKFLSEYAIGGPINEKTGQPYGANTKAFAEWAAAQGKPVLTSEQAALAENVAAGVKRHALAQHLLAQGVAEAVVRAPWQGVNCQIRMDFFSFVAGAAIIDFKTADDLTWFEADSRRYGYAHQMAFYRSVLAAAAQCDPRELPVHLIGAEKKPPYRAGVWKIGEDVLATAQRENEEAVKRLKECRQTAIWPTGYENIRTFDWI